MDRWSSVFAKNLGRSSREPLPPGRTRGDGRSATATATNYFNLEFDPLKRSLVVNDLKEFEQLIPGWLRALEAQEDRFISKLGIRVCHLSVQNEREVSVELFL